MVITTISLEREEGFCVLLYAFCHCPVSSRRSRDSSREIDSMLHHNHITRKFRRVVNFDSCTQVLPVHARFDDMNYGIILLDSLMIQLLIMILSYCCGVFAQSHWPERRGSSTMPCPTGAPAGSIYFVQFVGAQVNDKINPRLTTRF